MKKIFLILVVLLISASLVSAQKAGINVSGNVYFPVGDWADYASTGWGGTVGYEHPLGKNFLGAIYSGYTAFSGTENFDWTMIPLMFGGKFYFTPKQDFYGGAMLGVNFVTANFTYTDFLGNEYDDSESSTEFAANLLLGYEIKTGEKGAVDLSAGFIWINDLSYFGIRAGYIFKL